MLRRNYQPSSSGGSTSSDSDDEEKENVTAASENGEGKERGVQTPDVDRDSVTDKNTLLFPFLRDHGLESRPLCRYFNLTLGASMSREGNEGHAKTIQVMHFVKYYRACNFGGFLFLLFKSCGMLVIFID